MTNGYVYILINPSMPNLIKIGQTKRDALTRAKELSTSTGVPTPFMVVFEIFCNDCISIERTMHKKLEEFRCNTKREFFTYSVNKAIKLLMKIVDPIDETYSAIDITIQLQNKFPSFIKPDIINVRIVQPKNRVWLELTQEKERAGYLTDQIITRTDMAFINGDRDRYYFPPEEDIITNAQKFIDNFDAYSIAMTTDLFHNDACELITTDPR